MYIFVKTSKQAGGSLSTTIYTGASATLYGAGGGGGGGSNSSLGGSGGQGVVVFYFTSSPITTTDMTIWLDASSSSSWSAGSWKNSALLASSNATTYSGTWTSSSLVSGAINGLSALYFDGTNTLATTDPAGTYSSGFTLFIVFQPTAATTTYQTLINRCYTYAAGFAIYSNLRQIGSGTSTTYKNLTSPLNIKTLATNIPYLLVLRVEVKSSIPYVSEWFNGTNLYSNTTTSSYSDTATSVYIGNRGDKLSTVSYTGYMGEIIMYKKALSDTEVQTTSNYLASKWGITIASSIPTSNMTLWLDSSISTAWTAGTWSNAAVNKTSDATTFSGTWTTSSLVADVLNGLPGLQFTGTNSLATTDAAGTYSSGFTLFVVFEPTASETYRTLVTRTTSKYPRAFDMYNNSRLFGNSSSSIKTITSNLNIGSVTLNTAYVFALRVSISNSIPYVSEWFNGYQVYADTSGLYYSDTATKVFIGTREDIATSFTGYMGEIIMHKSALTDTEVDTTMNYLMGKWGITNLKEGIFSTVTGSLNQVDIDDDLLCGATSAGVVYCKNTTDSSWTKLPGTMTQVCVNNGELYAVNSSGNIYYSSNGKNTTAWTSMSGTLHQIDANGDIICGVNDTYSVPYCKSRSDSGWTKLSGTLSKIAVNSDGSLYGVNSSGGVYYKPSYTSTTAWAAVSGATLSPTSISADNDVVCGVNSTTSKAYCMNTNMKSSPIWSEVGSTTLEKVSVSKNRMAGVDTSDTIYMT